MDNNIHCRTCLAVTLNPRNVRDVNHKNLLEMLKCLLGFEIEDELFQICENCENTLNSFLKFKDMCLKSMQTNQCTEIKQEPLDCLQDSSGPYDIQNSKLKSIVHPNKSFTIQFPKADVLQAISELKTYLNSDKFTTCIHCDLVSKSVKGLSLHMTKNHNKLVNFWCNKCNVQTDDLQKHKKLAKCSEFPCKFCNNYCRMNEAVDHLQNHCHGSYTSDENEQELLLIETNSDPLKLNNSSTKTLENVLKNNKQDICSESDHSLKQQFRAAQFPKDDVLRTIFEFRKSRNVLTLKTCLHCRHVCKSARGLSIHMTVKHKDLEKLWCFYCNVQTEDLEKHKELRKCSYFFCKFCNYFAASMKQPAIHLQSHCRDISNLNGIAQEMLISEENNAEIDDGSTVEDPPFTDKSTLDYNLDQSTCATNDLQSSSSAPHAASYRLKQFPKNIVLKSIFEFRKFRNIFKLRSCLHCRHICKSARGLSIHMSHKHKDLLKSWCFQCNVQTDAIEQHKEVAKCSDFFCKFCNKYSVQMKEPITHLKSHCRDIHSSDESDQEILYGKRRNIGIEEKSQLDNHFEDNTSINYCYNKKASLKLKKRSFSKLCPICGKLIGRSSNLSKHLQIHNETRNLDIKKHLIARKKPYVCSVCAKAFVSSSDWKKHERIHEGGPQLCPICNVECCRPERLKLHMRRHTGENKFICAQCGISFHIKSILLKHIISHSDEKQFKCSFCDRYFKYTDQVTVHERTHTGIRPYVCTLCSYTSSRAKNLTNHMKKHPEDAPQANTPYKCQMCTMRFSTNAMRVSHTNNRHIMNNTNNNQTDNRS